MSFWKSLPKPFFALAPLADVTDAAFRRLIAKYGKPDVTWTEFVSADGLFMGGREALGRDLLFTPAERPIVAQFFTAKPEMMEKAAAFAAELGFDGIDINMGCPDRSIEKQGAGAAMVKDPKRAQEVIKAAKRGAAGLPVSVKTRIGYNRNELKDWLPYLFDVGIDALTLHARTRKEMSLVPARWEEVWHAVQLRREMKVDTLVIGNGDAADLADAYGKAMVATADGVMLGRAIFGNPWLFAPLKDVDREALSHYVRDHSIIQDFYAQLRGKNVPLAEKFSVMVEHTKLFEELLCSPAGGKNFAIMKKHYKAYVNGFDGAKEFRVRLMETKNAAEVERMVQEYLDCETGPKTLE